jgi:hypothetical protein
VKALLGVLVFAALFMGAVFGVSSALGLWEDVKRPLGGAPSTAAAPDVTTADEAVDGEETSTDGSVHARRARRHQALVGWRREANALCTRMAREARQLAREYEQPKGLHDLIALGQIALHGERSFLDQLAELERPRAKRALIRQMLALYEAHHRWFRRTVEALRRDNIGAAYRAGLRADELNATAGDMLAYDLGATKCGPSADGSEGLTLGVAAAG